MVPEGKTAKFRCHQCGEEFVHLTGKKGAITHADEKKHGRLEVIITKRDGPQRPTRIV